MPTFKPCSAKNEGVGIFHMSCSSAWPEGANSPTNIMFVAKLANGDASGDFVPMVSALLA